MYSLSVVVFRMGENVLPKYVRSGFGSETNLISVLMPFIRNENMLSLCGCMQRNVIDV